MYHPLYRKKHNIFFPLKIANKKKYIFIQLSYVYSTPIKIFNSTYVFITLFIIYY